MKILIISHNPLTTYHNMGKTMLNLFSCFEKCELCQFYIYPTLPDIDRCHSYFRITDKDVVKGLFRFFRVGGKVIDKSLISPSNKIHERQSDASVYHTSSDFKRLLRDYAWRVSHWYGSELKNWIRTESPDIIFIAPGDAEFIYEITLRIARDFSLPVVTYICDEFYFMSETKGFLPQYRLKRLKKRVESLMNVSSGVVAICEEIAAPYRELFRNDTIVIMTGSSLSPGEAKISEKPRVLQYMGGIRRNRHISLIQIGEALDRLNSEDDENYELRVYTDEQDSRLLTDLSKPDSVKVMGFVTGEEYNKAFKQADIFVHAEAFDKQSIDAVKHSVSTKIADILASGIPLIAFAPAEIASTSHLIRNQCAVCVTDARNLTQSLRKALKDTDGLQRCAENGIRAAERFHDTKKNSEKLADFIRSKVE